MNQTQANRTVRALNFFEGLKKDQVDLNTVAKETKPEQSTEDIKDLREQLEIALREVEKAEKALDNGEEAYCDILVEGELEIRECGTTACFCGWMPYIFPEKFKAGVEGLDDGVIYYDYPTLVDTGDEANSQDYADYFGLDYDSLEQMISSGNRPTGYEGRKYASDLEAITAFLTDQLEENGYEIEVIND